MKDFYNSLPTYFSMKTIEGWTQPRLRLQNENWGTGNWKSKIKERKKDYEHGVEERNQDNSCSKARNQPVQLGKDLR